MNAMNLWSVVKEAGSRWLEDKAPRLGAALAYYAIFSMAPLLVIAIGIAGLVFGQEAAQGALTGQMENLVGEQGAKAVRALLESADQPSTGLLGSLLGLVMLLFGAGGLFGQLQDALNTIWGVQPKPGQGIMGLLRERFLSISMVLGVAFLLLVSLIASTVVSAMGTLLGVWQISVVGNAATFLVDLGVVTLLFAMIFRFLPDAKIAWHDVWLGAIVTALLFSVGKFLIGLYLGHGGVPTAYGATGSLAALLVWLYYASQIFLFGAELTRSYANQFGSRIVPKAHAEPVTAEARAEQGIPRTEDHSTPARNSHSGSVLQSRS